MSDPLPLPNYQLFDAERFYQRVAQEDFAPMVDGEKSQLGMILSHPTMVKAIALAFRQVQNTTGDLMSVDLTTLSGIAGMIRRQGAVKGVDMFIATLAAYALTTPQQEEEGE